MNPKNRNDTSIIVLLALMTLSACTATPRVELREASAESVDGWRAMTPRAGDERFWVATQPFITNAEIERAEATTDSMGRRAVMLEFNDAGQAKMFAHTSARIGQPVAVLVDGKFICAPRVMSALRDRAMIVGATDAEIGRILRAFEKPGH